MPRLNRPDKLLYHNKVGTKTHLTLFISGQGLFPRLPTSAIAGEMHRCLTPKLQTMTTSFLDYYKMILDKVSFDSNLLTKEYQKATRSLHANEIGDLNSWLRKKGLQTVISDQSRNFHSQNGV